MTRRESSASGNRAEDHRALMDLLDGHEERDESIPCRTGGLTTTAAWISDYVDEQRAAAAACSPCPVKAECRVFGLTWRDELGVYGGLTQPERRTNQRPKEKQA